MAKKQWVSIGKRQVELSNLDKVLYPDDGIVKAQIIEYYLKIAPTILRHIKGRALSFIRYPDGIDGESFFQKNKPDWAPEWIEGVKLGKGKEKKNYIIVREEAVLVWTANLASIEIHQSATRQPDFDKPDYFVIDLDPPDGYAFSKIIEMSMVTKTILEGLGYTPFVKTTGRKSVHIVAPIDPAYSYDAIAEATKQIGQAIVKKLPKNSTLSIRKDARPDKVLVDIYRNRASQTIVSPYSLRALSGATVSMPITWQQLENTSGVGDYTIHNALDLLLEHGDAWEEIDARATPLHTERPTQVSAGTTARKNLQRYTQKRRFDKTPEPGAEEAAGEGNGFVLHRHHATRLHYDLRLEQEGTLKSWAVPKGLPPRPGVKRLAVHTEDHPMKYLDFQGSIPKGEYGGGEMWIYARGRYRITKTKKNGFYFRLLAPGLNSEYRIYETGGENQWLLERVETPQVDFLDGKMEPMLAEIRDKVPRGDYIYEVKWDGIRALIAIDDGQIRISSRNGKDITYVFPELCIPEEAFRVSSALFDGEIVNLDPAGKPVFKNVIRRLHHTGEGAIERSRKKYPAVCYLFDCLYMDGRPLVNDPLVLRREWLADSIKGNQTVYRFSDAVEDGDALFEAAKKMELEGIMAKEAQSLYQPGKRSNAWLKIKVRRTMDCLIIGFTEGKGDRSKTFGALHIAEPQGDKLQYLGKVGTGFNDKTMREIREILEDIPTGKRSIDEKPVDDAQSTWLKETLWCEVQYASITPNKTLREPVFLRLRPDLT